MASGVEYPKCFDLLSQYLQQHRSLHSSRHSGPLYNLLICWDDLQSVDLSVDRCGSILDTQRNIDYLNLQAVDVRGWLLEVALKRQNIDDVVILVERGAPMHEAATACIKSACDSRAGSSGLKVAGVQLATLIAAAHWAQRGDQLCQDIEAALVVHPGGKKVEAVVSPLPPSNTCEEACAKAVSAALLDFFVERGARDDQVRIELLMDNGVAMPRRWYYDEHGFTQALQTRRLKMLFKASCKAGRDMELLNMLESKHGGLVSRFLRNVSDRACPVLIDNIYHAQTLDYQVKSARLELQAFRDGGLLGPLARPLRIAILHQRRQMEYDQDALEDYPDTVEKIWSIDMGNKRMDCLISCEELLMEYAEADRRYAQYLATMLSQRTTEYPAKLVASFYVAEPADAKERRREDEESAAYTWKEFVEYYANVRDASRHWVHATPASHEEHLQPTEFYEEDTLPTSGNALGPHGRNSVIDFVLHVDPPARVQPEIAAQLVAVMEASAVERQLGSAVLEEAETEECIDRLVVLQFNRCSKELRNSLVNGLPLKRCREELEKEGYDFLLPCRNMVFVHPAQYHVARRAPIPQIAVKLSCFYLVVAESLEYLVEESLVGIGKGAWARAREALPLHNSTDAATVDAHDLAEEIESDTQQVPCIIKRTFLQFGEKPLRNTSSVQQSTTELHGGGMNPRRLLPIGM